MSPNNTSTSDFISYWTTTCAIWAAIGCGAMVAMQSDQVSRKILDAQKLDAKRRQEYTFQWQQGIERAHLQLDYYFAGGIAAYNHDPEIVFKKTEYLSSEHDMDALIHQIIKKKGSDGGDDDDSSTRFTCLKIDRDPMDPKHEFYIYLLEDHPTKGTAPQIYQLPLMAFGTKLAEAFENQITTTTLCFVADASAGKAITVLEALVKESKTGVGVISEPLWLLQMARLIQAQIFPMDKIKSLLFGLCRLDAWSLRHEVKESRTVMITLPGQATTSSLLPLLQATFPEDRHVFAYDTCYASVHYGIVQSKKYQRGKLQERLEDIRHGLCQNPIRHTTPLPSNTPITKILHGLPKSLSALPVDIAKGVETWMGSVDAFFKLKQEELKNGYLPYTLKISFLTQPDDPEFTPKSSASYWSLCSILQFITGCRSRPLPDGVIDAACRFLEDYNRYHPDDPKALPFDRVQEKAIEDCVFHHKLILIPNKTLQDTVLPSQHWTLKQAAKKGGCACCGPDPLEEEEAEEERKKQEQLRRRAAGVVTTGTDTDTPGGNNGGTSAAPARNNYVDGKLGFAFDPTKFS